MKPVTIILILLVFTSALSACGGRAAGNNDEEVISVVEKFQTARNEGDWDLAASYLAEDVVWETPTINLTGREAWLATTVPGIYEDVKSRRVEGNMVIVEMVVTGPDFVSPATAKVVVEDGKIQRYTVTPP